MQKKTLHRLFTFLLVGSILFPIGDAAVHFLTVHHEASHCQTETELHFHETSDHTHQCDYFFVHHQIEQTFPKPSEAINYNFKQNVFYATENLYSIAILTCHLRGPPSFFLFS